MKRENKASFFVVILLSAILIVGSFCHNDVSEAKSRVIAWDVYGYYIYLPAVFIYHDTREYTFAQEHLKNYQVSSDLYQLKKTDNKCVAPGYTMGLAILWLPFFILAHAFASITHLYPADGLSFPYQLAVVVASWFYAIIGLWFLRKTLLRFFSDYITALTIAAIVLGTNYFNYVSYESGMPHGLLFSLYGVLLYGICCWYEKPTIKLSVVIGFLIALACLCRPSEIVVVVFFIFYGLQRLTALPQRLTFFKKHWLQILFIVIAGCVTVAPQILYWRFNTGLWFYNGYEDHIFTFLKPQILNGLFSYRKGWLIYTPLMLLSLAGFFTPRIRNAGLFYAVFGYFIINLYIVFSWDTWWYASSFSCRALVQSYALLAFPLASFLLYIESLKPPLKALVYLFIVLCIALNQFQAWQYQHEILPRDETTKTYYWKVFGKTQITDPHIKRFLDIDEALPVGKTFTAVVLSGVCTDLASKVIVGNSFGPAEIFKVNNANLSTLSEKWVNVEARVKSSGDLCMPWHEALLVFTAERNGKPIKWSNMRFQGFIQPEIWDKVGYEVQLPVLQAGDDLKAFIWNQGPDTIFERCIELRLLKEKN